MASSSARPGIFLVYHFLERGTDYLVYSILSMDPTSPLTEAVRFFVFEAPKVLLLTGIVFVVGIIRSYFPPEKTRKALLYASTGLPSPLARAGVSRAEVDRCE